MIFFLDSGVNFLERSCFFVVYVLELRGLEFKLLLILLYVLVELDEVKKIR